MRLTPISRSDLIRRLRSLGWEGPFAGGNHQFMEKGEHCVPIPNPHSGGIDAGLLKTILKQAEVSREEWLNAR